MAKPIETIEELNTGLNNFLQDILKIGASSRSDVFDETVLDKLKKHLVGAKYVSNEIWTDKDSIFYHHYKQALKKDFDFSHLNSLVDNHKPLNLIIVDKPNGKQQWPDLLVIFNGIGFPIEVKSSKKDLIVWNSGLPRDNSLYIFNCYGKSKTTCFLGQHAISVDTRNKLLAIAKVASEINANVNDWGFYVRNMFKNDNRQYFEDDDLINKKNMLDHDKFKLEKKLKDIQTHTQDLHADLTIALKDKKEKLKINQKVIKKLTSDIEHTKKLIIEQQQTYDDRKIKRLDIEKNTIEFIQGLTWNKQQCSSFSFDEIEIIVDKNSTSHSLKS